MAEPQEKQTRFVTSIAPVRSLRILMAGWSVSIILHLLLFVIFLLSRSVAITPPAPTETPLGIVENPIAPLIQEPLISDLKMAPVVPQAISPAPSPLFGNPIPPLTPAIPAPSLPMGQSQPLFSLAPQARLAISAPRSSANLYQTNFCGSAADGDTICYVLDGSGSMVIAFDYIRKELRRSIHNLNPAQYFQIIFFSGQDPIPMSSQSLLRATASNIQAAEEFINKTRLEKVSSGEAAWKSVVNALTLAFRLFSDHASSADSTSSKYVLYLLTDGEYDHLQVKNAIDSLQAAQSKKVSIHVIACGNQNNERFLRQLAISHQGSYMFVSDEQLARQGKDQP